MKIPSRWEPYVRDVATRPGPLQARAERLVQEHLASHQRRLARSLPRRRAAREERQARSGATVAVRQAVVTRAAGRCEACGVDLPGPMGEMDHFFGRARSENVETCWFLCRECHQFKTDNFPTRSIWLRRFRTHAMKYGLGRALQMVDQALALAHPQETTP